MGSEQARLGDVYERLQVREREGESFSDVIDRLTSDYTLLDFAEDASGDYDGDAHRELVDASDEAGEDAASDRFDEPSR